MTPPRGLLCSLPPTRGQIRYLCGGALDNMRGPCQFLAGYHVLVLAGFWLLCVRISCGL